MKDLNIIEIEDPSVNNLLQQTANDLHKKYNKQRKINERFLKKKGPVKKFFSVILDIVCVCVLLLALVVSFSTINSTINGYMPNFFGYTNVIVASKSMVASGYDVGDILVIHSVDTDSLNVEDKIAFYVYSPSYDNINIDTMQNVSDAIKETKYTLSFSQLFGFQSQSIAKAANAKSKLVFHHIRSIYEDSDGVRWFKTYGSSNAIDDDWLVREDFIMGMHDEGPVSNFILSLINWFNKPNQILIIAIPVVILLLTLVFSFLKSFQIAKLELDCVEEKRKITDPICVKNKVGYQMDNKTKLKILAQATDDNKEEYINLLWKPGKTPANIKKYYQRKKLTININKDLLKLNRECEKMFKKKVKPTKIAKYYMTEKKKIEDRKESIRKRLKSIDRHKKNG